MMEVATVGAYLLLGISLSMMYEYARLVDSGYRRDVTVHVFLVSAAFALLTAYIIWPEPVLLLLGEPIGFIGVLLIRTKVRSARFARRESL